MYIIDWKKEKEKRFTVTFVKMELMRSSVLRRIGEETDRDAEILVARWHRRLWNLRLGFGFTFKEEEKNCADGTAAAMICNSLCVNQLLLDDDHAMMLSIKF